jgi:hypothetical protein
VLVISGIGSVVFLPRPTWSSVFLLCFPCCWEDRCKSSCPAIGWDGISLTFI